MLAKDLIEQLEQLEPDAECMFAEYDKKNGQIILWWLNICCNQEHQAEQQQVWFNKGFLAQ
jgi:hypothetical protein